MHPSGLVQSSYIICIWQSSFFSCDSWCVCRVVSTSLVPCLTQFVWPFSYSEKSTMLLRTPFSAVLFVCLFSSFCTMYEILDTDICTYAAIVTWADNHHVRSLVMLFFMFLFLIYCWTAVDHILSLLPDDGEHSHVVDHVLSLPLDDGEHGHIVVDVLIPDDGEHDHVVVHVPVPLPDDWEHDYAVVSILLRDY